MPRWMHITLMNHILDILPSPANRISLSHSLCCTARILIRFSTPIIVPVQISKGMRLNLIVSVNSWVLSSNLIRLRTLYVVQCTHILHQLRVHPKLDTTHPFQYRYLNKFKYTFLSSLFIIRDGILQWSAIALRNDESKDGADTPVTRWPQITSRFLMKKAHTK